MALAPLDELHFLTEALTAHVAWAKSTGGYGLPACDETWLQARREHYRQTPYVADPTEPAPPTLGAGGLASAPSTVPAEAPRVAQLAGGVAGDQAFTPATSPPVPSKVAEPPGSVISASAVAASSVSASATRTTLATPRAVPSTAGFEVAALVDEVAPSHDTAPRAKPTDNRAVSPLVTSTQPTEAVAALSVEERRTRLALLETRVSQCRDCGLCESRTNTVFARGNGSIGVAFVGEGPGADEDAQGYPFVGAAGQLLDKMIAAMGLERESVYVCNIVKCRPPNNRKPTEEEMATCRHYVVSQLELIQPRVIVALGATAVEGLLGLKLGITRMRGTWRLYKGSIPVMPTFHPAYLLRQPDAKREVWEDLQAVLTRINMPLPQRRK